MGAIAFRLRCWLGSSWFATALVTLVVALVSGTVLCFAAGAHRTATAPDRYAAALPQHFDAAVQQHGGAALTAEVARLPAVRSVAAASFVFGGLVRPDGGEQLDALVFAGQPEGLGAQLVDGRPATQSSPSEFVASRLFADRAGLHLGEHVRLDTHKPDGRGFGGRPDGPSFDLVLVGIVQNRIAELDAETPMAVVTSAVTGAGTVGVSETLMTVQLAPSMSIADLRDQLDSVSQPGLFSAGPLELVSDDVRRAVNAQALGLWVLAGVTALTGIVALGLVVGRHARMPADERRQLLSLGASERELRAEMTLRAALLTGVGLVAGLALSVIASPTFPVGFARRIEPRPGVRVDVIMIVFGVLALALPVVGWCAVTANGRRRGGRPAATVPSSLSRLPATPAGTGVRFAFVEHSGDATSPRRAVAAVALIVAGLAGTATFATSLGRLVSDPARFGSNFDIPYEVGADSLPTEVRQRLEGSAAISGLSYYATGSANHGPTDVPLEALRSVRGHVGPVVLSGQLPTAADEIAVGRQTADQLHTAVGDTLPLSAGGKTASFRVTGIIVVPNVAGVDRVGVGAVVTAEGLAALGQSTEPMVAAIDFADGVRPADVLSLLPGYEAADPNNPYGTPPAAIVNVARVRPILGALGVTLGALAVVVVLYLVAAAVRRRRKEVAVLRALGADRAWVAGIARSQAVVFSAVPSVIGVVVGIVAAGALFRRFAGSIGAVDTPTLPLLMIAGIVTGLVGVAAIVAAISTRSGLRATPATTLRDE